MLASTYKNIRNESVVNRYFVGGDRDDPSGGEVCRLRGRAIAGANARMLPGETLQDLMAHIEKLMKQAPVLDVECKILRGRPDNPVASVESAEFKTLQRTIHEVFPDEIVAAGLTAVSTDSPWYYGLTDSVFRFIPMRLNGDDLERIHGVDERIAVENMAEIVVFYRQLITNAAGPE